jgi:hypothetical protein
MNPTFKLLNPDWNADPISPDPVAKVSGSDLLLTFAVNTTQFGGFLPGDIGVLPFGNCKRFRLGPTNEAGWLKGQCRFSGKAPAWGEFYLVHGEIDLLEAPHDLSPRRSAASRTPSKSSRPGSDRAAICWRTPSAPTVCYCS